MKKVLLLLLLFSLSSTFLFADFVERIDGGGIIGTVQVKGEQISVEDWDGKTYTFYREFIRRMRAEETGKFNTYSTETKFDIHTDAPESFALELVKDLEIFETFINESFGIKKPPQDRISIRIFSSTKDYENHWSNRFGDTASKKMTLSFYDDKYKDVSSCYAGRDTFTLIAPQVAMVFIMRVYPKVFNKPPLWLRNGWYNLFKNTRVTYGEVDMVGLDNDTMEFLQEKTKDKPFTLASFLDYKLPVLDPAVEEKKDLKTRQREAKVYQEDFNYAMFSATAFFHFMIDNSKKYGKKVSAMFNEMEEYAEPLEAITSSIEKKTDALEKKINNWLSSYEASSPWRLYYKAEGYFLRKRTKNCLKILDEAIPKFKNFENFRKLRAMVYLREKDSENARADIKELEKNPLNAEMCMYFEALILIQEEEYRKSVDILKKLIESDPKYFRCYEMLLNIFWEQTAEIVTAEEALRYVELLKENEPYSYTFLLEGKYYMKIGEPENAKVPLQKALRRDPENEDIKKLQRERAKQAREKAQG